MNVLLPRWDTKPDKRMSGTFPRHGPTLRTSLYAAIARTCVLAWAVDVEVDPMVGGVVRFVDSGFWRGA
jgi:hypothetical protein